MTAYHFLRSDMTTASGNEPPWTVGETRHIAGTPVMCERGYHSSPTWFDALQYAPGPIACIVEVGGTILTDTDKQVSTERTLVDCRDAAKVLRLFACDCAEHVLHIYEGKYPDDPRPRRAIETARHYVDGRASDDELRTAKAAADAADAANAARAAADAAYAARAAEGNWQRERLHKVMLGLFA